MKTHAFDGFLEPLHDLGRSRALRWLRSNGMLLQPAPDLGSYQPDAYGKRGEVQIVAVVETAESLRSPTAGDRMRACTDWSRESSSRKGLLFVPRGAVKEAAERLADYDGMVVY